MRNERYVVVLAKGAVSEVQLLIGTCVETSINRAPRIWCKAVDTNGPYVRMTVEYKQEGKSLDVEVQIPHHYVSGILYAQAPADLKHLGFT